MLPVRGHDHLVVPDRVIPQLGRHPRRRQRSTVGGAAVETGDVVEVDQVAAIGETDGLARRGATRHREAARAIGGGSDEEGRRWESALGERGADRRLDRRELGRAREHDERAAEAAADHARAERTMGERGLDSAIELGRADLEIVAQRGV
jgi:hypothetical protein